MKYKIRIEKELEGFWGADEAFQDGGADLIRDILLEDIEAMISDAKLTILKDDEVILATDLFPKDEDGNSRDKLAEAHRYLASRYRLDSGHAGAQEAQPKRARYSYRTRDGGLDASERDQGRRKEMRDPARIDRIMKKLQKRWESVPDLRLGQLIYAEICSIRNGDMPPMPELFYLEDDVFEDGLKD